MSPVAAVPASQNGCVVMWATVAPTDGTRLVQTIQPTHRDLPQWSTGNDVRGSLVNRWHPRDP
ncbi:hypothetical protein GCM10027590_45100 [Nocardiopsis nanhaiensis]